MPISNNNPLHVQLRQDLCRRLVTQSPALLWSALADCRLQFSEDCIHLIAASTDARDLLAKYPAILQDFFARYTGASWLCLQVAGQQQISILFPVLYLEDHPSYDCGF